MTWIPAVKRSMNSEQFEEYASRLKFKKWRPLFTVLHNTGVPRLDQWHDYPVKERMNGLEHYYRDVMHWHAGPHLFISDTEISVFTPLTVSGIHSPSWNHISWGVEMVGDYTSEAFNLEVKANTVSALATLHAAVGMDSHMLKFHKMDPLTSHKFCPGDHVNYDDMVHSVHQAIMKRHAGEHPMTGALAEDSHGSN